MRIGVYDEVWIPIVQVQTWSPVLRTDEGKIQQEWTYRVLMEWKCTDHKTTAGFDSSIEKNYEMEMQCPR